MNKSFCIELSHEAEIDFEKSYKFYLNKSKEVAESFLKETDKGFNQIQANPYLYPLVHNDARKFLVRKFPFVIYYSVSNSSVKVIAIFHTSRAPRIWDENC